MTTAVKPTPTITRAEAVRLLRMPGAYAVGEMRLTPYSWIRRPGHPDVQVSKHTLGWVRDHYPGEYDRSVLPWKWYLTPKGEI